MNQTRPLKSAAIHTVANLQIILGIFRPTGSFHVNQVIAYYVVVRQKTKTTQPKSYIQHVSFSEIDLYIPEPKIFL